MKRFITNQKQDYPIQFAEFPGAYVRSLYARAAESRPLGSEGQDYLTWSYAGYGFGFVVCDGVGSSFCGNIAARYLGEKLIQFLLDTGPRLAKIDKPSGVAELVTARLQAWQEKGHEAVEATEIPPGLPPLQVTALEQLKAEQGSEAVFVCGWLSFDEGRLILVWMGDAEARLFDHHGEPIDVGGVWRNADRWSTKHGPYKRGARVHAWVGDVEELGLDRIMAFSDGLSAVADELSQLQDAELQGAVGRQLLSPSSDDIAFVDVRLRQPAVSDELAAPEVEGPDDGRLAWAEVAGARRYEIEEAGDGVFASCESHRVKKTRWPLSRGKLPETGYRHYRVRALDGKMTGPWSRALRLPPPEIPAPASVWVEAGEAPGSYTIVWEAVPDAQYYVLRELEGGEDREIYLGPALEHAVTEQQPGKYVYRVRACGPAGQSGETGVRHEVVGQGDPGPSGERDEGAGEVMAYETESDAEDEGLEEPATHEEVEGAGESPAETESPASGPRVIGEARTDPARGDEGSQQNARVGPQLAAPRLEKMGVVETGRRFTVRWSEVEGADSYQLQGNPELMASNEIFEELYAGSERVFETKRESTGRYVYRVRAVNAEGESAWSDPKAIEVEERRKLATPAGVMAIRMGVDAIQVQWQPVRQAGGYVVEEERTPSSSYAREWRVYKPELLVQNLKPGAYQYRVRAQGKGAEDSGWSDWTGELEVAEAPPSPPLQLTVDESCNVGSYTIEWNHNRAVSHYLLLEARSPDFSEPTMVHHAFSHRVYFSRQPVGRYYYRVFASNSDEKYDPDKPSNTVEVVVRPIKPRMFFVRPKYQGQSECCVELTWKDVPDASQYEIRNRITGEIIDKSSSNDFVIQHLTEGEYSFQVRAVSNGGIESEWSEEKDVKVERKADRLYVNSLFARGNRP